MKTDVAYEVLDFRTEAVTDRIGVIRVVPGGLNLYTLRELPIRLQWNDDDDEAFVDDEDAGRVTILTPEGRVELVVLTLDNWVDLNPFWDGLTPEFKTDGEVNQYFYERLRAF